MTEASLARKTVDNVPAVDNRRSAASGVGHAPKDGGPRYWWPLDSTRDCADDRRVYAAHTWFEARELAVLAGEHWAAGNDVEWVSSDRKPRGPVVVVTREGR